MSSTQNIFSALGTEIFGNEFVPRFRVIVSEPSGFNISIPGQYFSFISKTFIQGLSPLIDVFEIKGKLHSQVDLLNPDGAVICCINKQAIERILMVCALWPVIASFA